MEMEQFIDRLDAVGYGEADPVATNDTEEGRARNRRVELHIIQP
jgi:OOP family OmpA-OmpF porin